MTKSAIARELHNVRTELEWLLCCEHSYNPEWHFMSQPYSKRRARLVKTWWALKALQTKGRREGVSKTFVSFDSSGNTFPAAKTPQTCKGNR